MDFFCPNCNNRLSEQEITGGMCSGCHKVVDCTFQFPLTQQKPRPEIELSVSITRPSPQETQKALSEIWNLPQNRLLREATQRKKEGDFDSAVRCLREAYKIIASTTVGYSVQTFLRLPLYLQQAGKKDEAWKEFENLVKNGYPNQGNDKIVRYMENAIIYDKMRLFLQREKKFIESAKLGIIVYICLRAAEKVKGYRELFGDAKPTVVKTTIEKVLLKANKINLLPEVLDLIEKTVARKLSTEESISELNNILGHD